jgi:rhamnulokinase
VLAGPVEATAVGNLLVQAWAAGELGSLAEVRAVVARSLPTRLFEPHGSDAAEAAYARFRAMLDSHDKI